MLRFFLIAVVSMLNSLPLFANQFKYGQKVASCIEPIHKSKLNLYRKQQSSSKFDYFLFLKVQGSKVEVMGPAEEVEFDDNDNTLTLGFELGHLGVIVKKGHKTHGGVVGEVGGEEIVCEANW